jgi:hypothetical protein
MALILAVFLQWTSWRKFYVSYEEVDLRKDVGARYDIF